MLRLAVAKFSVHGRNKEFVKTYMGDVYRGTHYKRAEDIQDSKVVVVPKVEGKIFPMRFKFEELSLNLYYT